MWAVQHGFNSGFIKLSEVTPVSEVTPIDGTDSKNVC